jgi:hypothetical protein
MQAAVRCQSCDPVEVIPSNRPDITAPVRPLPFALVAVAPGLALVALAGTGGGGGGGGGAKPSASTSVVEASNDSRFRSL